MLSPCLLLPVLFIIASGFAAARDGGDCGGDSNACDDVVLEVGDELIIIMLPFSISGTPHACAEEICFLFQRKERDASAIPHAASCAPAVRTPERGPVQTDRRQDLHVVYSCFIARGWASVRLATKARWREEQGKRRAPPPSARLVALRRAPLRTAEKKQTKKHTENKGNKQIRLPEEKLMNAKNNFVSKIIFL